LIVRFDDFIRRFVFIRRFFSTTIVSMWLTLKSNLPYLENQGDHPPRVKTTRVTPASRTALCPSAAETARVHELLQSGAGATDGAAAHPVPPPRAAAPALPLATATGPGGDVGPMMAFAEV